MRDRPLCLPESLAGRSQTSSLRKAVAAFGEATRSMYCRGIACQKPGSSQIDLGYLNVQTGRVPHHRKVALRS